MWPKSQNHSEPNTLSLDLRSGARDAEGVSTLGVFSCAQEWVAVFLLAQNVRELGRVEHLAAHLALDKFNVLLTGDDADLGMFARCGHMGWIGSSLPSPKHLVNEEVHHRPETFARLHAHSQPQTGLHPGIRRRRLI